MCVSYWRLHRKMPGGRLPAGVGRSHLLSEVYSLARGHTLGGRTAFVENYALQVAKYLGRGVDVWLNTPRVPREASGTSGQKATLNGVPHCSVLDGWWDEGYKGTNGWAIDSRVPETAAEDELY